MVLRSKTPENNWWVPAEHHSNVSNMEKARKHTERLSSDRKAVLSVWVGLFLAIGEENGNPLQYSCLENLMDGGAW